MADPGGRTAGKRDNEDTSIVRTFNMVPQKVIQVNKPAGYYKDREKTKIFIY